MPLVFRNALAAGVTLIGVAMLGGCPPDTEVSGDPNIPLDYHPILPEIDFENGQVASGLVTGTALEQPIAFPHYTHASQLGMECEYCHSAARRSIHSGVPSTQVCMGCHKYVKKDSPEIQKLTAYWEANEPIPWKKVHDLPDYVHFSHKRHIGAGLDCTECHGQVGLQGQKQWVKVIREGDRGVIDVKEEQAVTEVMIRETSLQMGWCLQCHEGHPSVDQNYQDKAEVRRAELKDCWTCHK